jgi:putative nucleotidyltransferase with HDIG domain
MQHKQLEQLKEWFANYVRTFYTADDEFLNNNLHLKECHTRRVCAEMRSLAESLTMNPADAILAESIALLHDVGRFEQFKKYRTYKDTISENHCLLGLRIIHENNLTAAFPDGERSIIEKAVKFHGAKELPAMDERTLRFAQMIRDTDKLDIFRLCVENYKQFHENKKAFTFEVEFPDSPEVSPAILESILKNQLIDYRLIKTLTDAKLLQLGWVFDTYFDWTLRQMRDRGYIDGIICWLPQTAPVQHAISHIRNYVTARLSV